LAKSTNYEAPRYLIIIIITIIIELNYFTAIMSSVIMPISTIIIILL
jgi:hypothetical protein